MSLTDGQIDTLNDPYSPHVLLAFATIEHPALETPIRAVTDTVDYLRGGETYKACMFGYRLVTDAQGAPRTVMQVPNVMDEFGPALRQMDRRPQVTVEILSSEDFDLTASPRTEIGSPPVIYKMLRFEMASINVDAVLIEAQVVLREFSQEPFPRTRATQDRFPGLFA